ncbi:hypothetical protein [Portibacter lacus]|uniref:Uncharacterized protein n=1 Tax=Portibacter lacus TaxID=1099794 RepID=A0AA37SMC5_9BACT|nr:hypothetical protein [Portibacter lacus]GLR17363.1 hypothetical protein GCM10007940_19780 [Portibacter lacus]
MGFNPRKSGGELRGPVAVWIARMIFDAGIKGGWGFNPRKSDNELRGPVVV